MKTLKYIWAGFEFAATIVGVIIIGGMLGMWLTDTHVTVYLSHAQ